MKLAAIYNVWDNVEMLKGSMECMKNDVQLFIIVYQTVSNFGEEYNPLNDMDLNGFNHILVEYKPEHQAGQTNETAKRNLGLETAKSCECTHFLLVDCDEYYEDFSSAKKEYENLETDGSVCPILTYFKSPTWRFENLDNYYVPFIHKLFPYTIIGYNRNYPYYVDRTRMVDYNNVGMVNQPMHHFSWVRKDIEKKARNSSAKYNIERSDLLKDYHNPEVKPGFFVKDFNQKLVEVDNVFKIKI